MNKIIFLAILAVIAGCTKASETPTSPGSTDTTEQWSTVVASVVFSPSCQGGADGICVCGPDGTARNSGKPGDTIAFGFAMRTDSLPGGWYDIRLLAQRYRNVSLSGVNQRMLLDTIALETVKVRRDTVIFITCP